MTKIVPPNIVARDYFGKYHILQAFVGKGISRMTVCGEILHRNEVEVEDLARLKASEICEDCQIIGGYVLYDEASVVQTI